MGKTWDTGRDRGGMEPVEYCDSLFFDACDIGRERLVRRTGGDAASGGNEDWVGVGDCADVETVGAIESVEALERIGTVGGGDVAGEEDEGDTIVAMIGTGLDWQRKMRFGGAIAHREEIVKRGGGEGPGTVSCLFVLEIEKAHMHVRYSVCWELV